MGDDTPSTSARHGGSAEPIFWILALGLTWTGMSGTLVVIGLYAMVVPGLLLLAAPNVLMYGAPLRLAFAMGRRRSIPGLLGAAIVVGLVCGAALIPPMVVNEQLKAQAARLQAGDFDHVPPGMPAPRVIQLEMEHEARCQEICQRLLARGLADQVVLLEDDEERISSRARVVYRLSEDCSQTSDDNAARSCILRSVHPDPRVDAVLKMAHLTDEEREADPLNPLALGAQSVEVLELWTCPEAGHCNQIIRRASVVQERLFAPMLFLAAEESMRLERAWTRLKYGSKADPTTFLASKWPAKAVTPSDWLTIVPT